MNPVLLIGFSKNMLSWYKSEAEHHLTKVEHHFTIVVANHVSKFANTSYSVQQSSI